MAPAHGVLHAEALRVPGLPEKLRASIGRQEWGADYFEHVLVRSSTAEPVFPLALYVEKRPRVRFFLFTTYLLGLRI